MKDNDCCQLYLNKLYTDMLLHVQKVHSTIYNM